MNARTIDRTWHAAKAAGLVPLDAAPVHVESRPWPVVLLTALGAWLAAIPLLFVVAMLMADFVSRGAGPYVIGPLALAGAIVVLRARGTGVFIEQLALPALLVGGGTLAFGLFRDAGDRVAPLLLALISASVAWLIDRAWLRVLLGAAAAGLVALALQPLRFHGAVFDAHVRGWFTLHLALLLPWAIAQAALARSELLPPRAASLIESFAAGWLLLTLTGLCLWSGMTFLMAGNLGGGLVQDIGRELSREPAHAVAWPTLRGGSVLLALLAAAAPMRAWRNARRPAFIGVALLLAVLAAFLPALGAALFALGVCASTQRWRLAGAGALAVAWIVGSFYYQLNWPLATKAIVLAAVGAGLAALAFVAWPREVAKAATRPRSMGTPWSGALVALAGVAVLGVANVGIWQKERIIAQGQAVFVELAPVDPRSLMQGDYMQLNFRLPSDAFSVPMNDARPYVVARRDERGVAQLLRLESSSGPLAPGEFRIELAPKNGRWILVSDAWFFKEGQAPLWSQAKYGEFRVDPDGRALLVGLADAALRPIKP